MEIIIQGVWKWSQRFEKLLWSKTYEVFDQLSLLIRLINISSSPIEKSLVCDNHLWLGGCFWKSSKMQLRQVNENQNSFEIN